MTVPPATAFSLIDYKFTEFSYTKPSEENLAISLNFIPSGSYNQSTKTFTVTLAFSCSSEKLAITFINATIQADFMFAENISLAEIPPFFYVNSIAIVFPYVRSFISTLTLQANSGLVILPTLNLSGLEKGLREATKVAG